MAATRESYDRVAVDYAALLADELVAKPFDRALLTAFAELAAGAGGTIADLGCGPGRVAGFLHATGADVFGIDLSPAMVAEARRRFPALRFEVGDLSALDVAAASVGGVVAWYSVIHTPDEGLPGVFAEFARVLRPGGWLLLASQTGDGVRRLSHAYGHDVDLQSHRRTPALLSALLAEAGLETVSTTVRRPEPPESVAQAYLLARLA